MRNIAVFFILLSSACFSKVMLDSARCEDSIHDKLKHWEIRWHYARVLTYAGESEKAILQYQKLIEEKPKIKELKIELINIYLGLGKKREALAILEEVPFSSIDNSTRILLAELYLRDNEYEKAEKIYKKALIGDPSNVSIRLGLASIYTITKNYDEAISQYQAILRKRPKDIQVRRKYGFVLMLSKKYKLAAKEIEETL